MAARPLGGTGTPSSSLQPLPLLILLLLLISADHVPTSSSQPSISPAPSSGGAPGPSTTVETPAPLPPPPQAGAPAPLVSHPRGNGDNNEKVSSSGMSAGKKVGIAFGVIMGAGVVGLGGYVYKKRRANIRRSKYAYAARLHQL